MYRIDDLEKNNFNLCLKTLIPTDCPISFHKLWSALTDVSNEETNSDMD
jgi:hypothetical protein